LHLSAAVFSEKIVHLPAAIRRNDSKRLTAAIAPTRADLGLPTDAFVFTCFNNLTTQPAVVGTWIRLLKACPNSLLWLYYINDSAQANLQQS